MGINERGNIVNIFRGTSGVGAVAVALLVGLTGFAVLFAGRATGTDKVVVISWVAFAAMAGAAPLGARSAGDERALTLVWGYGLASGAMVTSAAVFLLPQAFGLHPKVGGFGVAAGLLTGFGAHTVGHRFTHVDFGFDHTALELTAHALSAGAIIGIIYGNMPELGPLLGLAIVSHKGPAGYAAARRLASDGRPVSVLLLPAAGVGLTAIPAALVQLPANQTLNAAVFGFAAGVFLHVAMDFLPECELGGEVYEVAQVGDDAHHLLDRLRLHAVGSTAFGALVVFAAWLVVS
ncbi:ZIP family metal transporter [Halostella litorea]|uniref:ZIP family metal transporter n=1 Tax=Halostella litorea TaxID=2528831 RepID=UPI001092A640|nr:ZIP family metal transporter [Halostella litorea]